MAKNKKEDVKEADDIRTMPEDNEVPLPPDAKILLLQQAIELNKKFINEVDRHGMSMQVLSDHRHKVDKFLALVAKELPDGCI